MYLSKLIYVPLAALVLAFFPAVFISCAATVADPGSISAPGLTRKPVASQPETPTKPVDSISIAAVGDIMMGSPFPNDSRMPPNDGRDLLSPAWDILRSADIAFGNLEGPLADGGISEKCGAEGRPNCFAFRMPTHYSTYLKEAGFDVMSVANNHASDFGASGRASTRFALDKMGIKYAGGDSGKFSTAYLNVGGKKIAFIGFATNAVSLNVNDLASAKAAVRTADRAADIVVVSCHCGAEGSAAKHVPGKTEIFFREKRGNLPLFARTVIDAGADLVLGHGPHVLRGMEIYKDRLIAYSLGNFATYGWFRLEGDTAETMVLVVDVAPDGTFTGAKIYPYKLIDRGILETDDSGSSINTVRTLSNIDFPDSAPRISDDGTVSPRSASK